MTIAGREQALLDGSGDVGVKEQISVFVKIRGNAGPRLQDASFALRHFVKARQASFIAAELYPVLIAGAEIARGGLFRDVGIEQQVGHFVEVRWDGRFAETAEQH